MESPNVTRVAVDALDDPINGSRDSIDPEKLGELADDMAANGLLQPIGVRRIFGNDRFEVIWGHRRTAAARLLQWPLIDAKVYPADTDPVRARLAENLAREQLTPTEEARACAELHDRGWPEPNIARAMRRSVPWVRTRLALHAAPEDVKKAVGAGLVSISAGAMLADIRHDGYRATLVEEAARTGATARTISVWLAHYNEDRERIEANHETVQQMLTRREEYVVRLLCDACRSQVDSRDTALLRVCAGCLREMRDAQRAAGLEGSPVEVGNAPPVARSDMAPNA